MNRWRYTWLGQLGDWIFWQVERPDDTDLFTFSANTIEASGDPGKHTYELYGSIEYAMAAAIAEKHTGRRGAGGTGVGTAADWFMKMIGAEDA